MTADTVLVTARFAAADSFTARRSAVELLEATPCLRSTVAHVAGAGSAVLLTVVDDAGHPAAPETGQPAADAGQSAPPGPTGTTARWSESVTGTGCVGLLGVSVDARTAATLVDDHDGQVWQAAEAASRSAAEPAVLGVAAPREDWQVADLLAGAPDTVAVADGHLSLDYATLRTAVEGVAARVLAAGDVQRVLLRGRRDVPTVVAMLGCWWAGATWCAVDVTSPAARREAIVAELRPDLVLDTADLDLVTDPDRGQPVRSRGMDRDTPAYAVATSGSTGRPKVSVLPAGGLRPLLAAWRQEYDFSSPQTVCQIGSLEGDVLIGDLLKALSTGGTLHIVPDEHRADPEAIADLLDRHRCTFVESTPVLIAALLRALDRRTAHWPAVAVVGSDVFRASEARDLADLAAGRTRVVNGYGTTECMIESLVHDCDAVPADRSGLCPVGTPLTGTAVTIRRPDGAVAEVGEVGRLHLAAPGAMMGYLVAGELQPGSPEVDTGDLAAVDPAGFVDFHGRADAMVKVRGHRVEPAEVEDALLRLAGVREAHVTSFRRSGATELMAFVCGPDVPTPVEIRTHLRQRLVEGAVPAELRVLDRLPRLETGKVDRLALDREAARHAESLLPQQQGADAYDLDDPVQLREAVIACWRAVLGVTPDPAVGFFDQGGSSVLLIALAEALRGALGPELVSVADLFRHPSVDAYVAMIERSRAAPAPDPQDAAEPAPAGRREILEAVAAGRMTVAEARRLMAR